MVFEGKKLELLPSLPFSINFCNALLDIYFLAPYLFRFLGLFLLELRLELILLRNAVV